MPIVPNSRFALQDWRSHKEYCSKIKAAGANSLDAILFAVNETKPRLVKIPWELILGEEDEPPFQRLDADIWFKHKDKFETPVLSPFGNQWTGTRADPLLHTRRQLFY